MGVRSMPYFEAEGKPQFGGMGSGGSSGGGSGYTLPVASASRLGGVKIGSGLSIDGTGVVSVSGGSGGLAIETTESTVGTYKNKTLYSIALEGYGSASSWTSITGFSGKVVSGFVDVVAQSGDIYSQPCEFCTSGLSVEYKTMGTSSVGTSGTLTLFYTKE